MITKVGETSDIVHVTVQRAAGHFEELWLEVKKLHETKEGFWIQSSHLISGYYKLATNKYVKL